MSGYGEPVSPVLRRIAGAHLSFFCPGCGRPHTIRVSGDETPRWEFDGNLERPTFAPSILCTWPAKPDASEDFKEWRAKRVCHSFVKGGRIEFLDDCTHALAGKTVDLPEFPL